MGCDIEIVLEKKWKDKWVSIPLRPSINYDFKFDPEERCYSRFAKMAGVQGKGPDPKGLPKDASDYTCMLFENIHHHSHSWLSLKKACEIYKESYDHPEEITLEKVAEQYFGVVAWPGELRWDEYRICFAFDG